MPHLQGILAFLNYIKKDIFKIVLAALRSWMIWSKLVTIAEGSPVLQQFSPVWCLNKLLHGSNVQGQKSDHYLLCRNTVYFHTLEYKSHNHSRLSKTPFSHLLKSSAARHVLHPTTLSTLVLVRTFNEPV